MDRFRRMKNTSSQTYIKINDYKKQKHHRTSNKLMRLYIKDYITGHQIIKNNKEDNISKSDIKCFVLEDTHKVNTYLARHLSILQFCMGKK